MVTVDILILLGTFYLLAKIVDNHFVQSLEMISAKLKLSSDIAGATFMAIGSSAPELFVSFLALFRISNEMSIGAGTIVGSAIFNILVIIGASALFKRATLTWQPVIRDLTFYIFCILIVLTTFLDGQITILDALLYVGVYIIYLFSFKVWRKIFPYEIKSDIDAPELYEESTNKNLFEKALAIFFFDLNKRPNLYLVNFLISVLLIGIATHFMVEAGVGVAHFFKLSPAVIGLTILAAGTSVPDLLASINVAKKGYGDMAVSNAVGSNVFDIGIGLGLPWVIILLITGRNLPVDTENLYSSVVLLFATVIALLFLLIAKKWEIGRYAGVLLIASYVFYLLLQIEIVSMSLCLNIGRSLCFVS